MIYERSGDGEGVEQIIQCWRGAGEGTTRADLSGLGLVLPSDGGLGKIASCGLNRLHAPSLICHDLHDFLTDELFY